VTAQVAADLRAAAEVLRRDGWIQGTYGVIGGPSCAAGAVMQTVADSGRWIGMSIEERQRYRVVMDRLSLTVIGQKTRDDLVALWNDAPGRTADEVIAALEAAADAAEADQ